MELTVLLRVIMFLSYGNSEPALMKPGNFHSECNCTRNNHLLITNCSNLELSELPIFPLDVNVLDLSFNSFEILKNKSFDNLHQLIQLNLSNNQLLHLASDAFYGLSRLQNLNLNSNYLKYDLESFPKLIFKPLILLTHLNVAHNSKHADKFPDEVISHLTNLRSISIDAKTTESNETPFGIGFLQLIHLQTLTIHNCNLHFNSYTFENLKYLHSIDLYRCLIRTYTYGTLSGRHLEFLNLVKLRLRTGYSNIRNSIMVDLSNTTEGTLIMTEMFIDQNIHGNLGYLIRKLENTTVQTLYLNRNNIYMFENDVRLLPKTLMFLDLSNNVLEALVISMPNLIFLNLTGNKLGNFLQRSRYCRSNITKLKAIYLSDNGIDRLIVSIFHGHPQLEIIDLSRNALIDINFDLAQLQNLRLLDLSSNRISSLSPMSINVINEIFKKSDLKINLSNNVLQCSCETYQFLKWMAENSNHFMPSNNYKCRFSNSSILEIQEFKHTFLQIARECESHAVFIICVSIAIFAMLTVTIVGLVYRYRWRIRYLYYMTKSKYKQNKPVDNCYQHKYDAFISYADSEVDFVLKDCIENFEQHGHKTLCIHQRDFIPGEEIANNISNAIHESRKTICIVTRSFLDSYYCMFEYNMARMESIYSRNGQNILFLVFYEQIRPKELPLVMLELVQQHSYIEYPHDEQGNVVFWAKLIEAIS
ncbi:toll-like receptor 4 [Mytilus trossulus]|uniref:toll-like receptor 4 n=1 Tax=Mytilus trossulus TaxID=6551 RepID=UPI0030075EFB